MKKFIKYFIICFMVLLLPLTIFAGCDKDKNKEEEYIDNTPSKTFTYGNITITATSNYILDVVGYNDLFVLEGLGGDSIVAFFDSGNSYYNKNNVTLSQFASDVLYLGGHSDDVKINDMIINNTPSLDPIVAKYFTIESHKVWQGSSDTENREHFNINLFGSNYYNYIVVCAKVDNAFFVCYIGGKQDTFLKKYNYYLSYAKSLIITSPQKVTPSQSNIAVFNSLFLEQKNKTNDEIFSSSGLRFSVPAELIYTTTSGQYVKNSVYSWLSDSKYGSIDITAYNKRILEGNSQNMYSYSYDISTFSETLTASPYSGDYINHYFITKINNKLTICTKEFSVIDDHENGPGLITETLHFEFEEQNTIYSFKISISLDFEGDSESSDFSHYLFHSLNDDVYQVLNLMEDVVFEVASTVEII